MSATGGDWNALSAGEADPGRRRLLVVSASAAAALLLAANTPLLGLVGSAAVPATTPADFVRTLPKRRWDWAVEFAVLHQLDLDRAHALALLWAALELDLDPSIRWRRKRALRLYDLYAAASDASGRRALAMLVTANSADPALLARAARWSDPSPRRPPTPLAHHRPRRPSSWHPPRAGLGSGSYPRLPIRHVFPHIPRMSVSTGDERSLAPRMGSLQQRFVDHWACASRTPPLCRRTSSRLSCTSASVPGSCISKASANPRTTW